MYILSFTLCKRFYIMSVFGVVSVFKNFPSGTGKTLVARALANECSSEGKKVAFFMRKGADCLSKWVGESERQLRLLFDQVCDFHSLKNKSFEKKVMQSISVLTLIVSQ